MAYQDSDPVFTAGERCFTWSDVIDAAQARGDWAQLQREERGLLARDRQSAATDSQPSDDEIRAAAVAFRYRRRLLSGDELNAWLQAAGITLSEWTTEMRRSVLEPASADVPVNDTELERDTWVHAVCSGALGEYANRFAEEVAVHLGEQQAVDDLAGLSAGWERFCRDRSHDSALTAEIESNKMNWTRTDLHRLIHDDEMVVREAALCVRMDGRTLAEVSVDAGAALEETSTALDDAEPALRSRLIAARDGDLIGPLRIGEHYELALVVRRIAPRLDDDAIRTRARKTVVERALAAEVSRQVNWHWHEHL